PVVLDRLLHPQPREVATNIYVTSSCRAFGCLQEPPPPQAQPEQPGSLERASATRLETLAVFATRQRSLRCRAGGNRSPLTPSRPGAAGYHCGPLTDARGSHGLHESPTPVSCSPQLPLIRESSPPALPFGQSLYRLHWRSS